MITGLDREKQGLIETKGERCHPASGHNSQNLHFPDNHKPHQISHSPYIFFETVALQKQ